MHNNYYFLRQLSKELESRLTGAVVSQCFSQSKDELVLGFETTTNPFFIKASLLPSFSCLSFSENFQRARKNSVDLFDVIIGSRLHSIKQFENERSFALQFNDELSLLFKMHGNRSNIILFQKNEVIQVFRNNIPADGELNLNALDRIIDWGKENFINHQDQLKETYFTFGKVVWQYLSDINFDAKDIDEKWFAITDLLRKLEKPTYVITEINSAPTLSLLPHGNIIKKHHDAIQAITDFYYTYTQTFAFTNEKLKAISLLKSDLHHYQNYFHKTSAKLQEVEGDNNYKIWADLIMANMHAIKPRAEKIILTNFYNNDQPVEIKLKKDFTPQKNAEIFYKKSKNQHLELKRLHEALTSKEKDIDSTKEKIKAIEATSDIKSLRSVLSSFGMHKEKEKQPELLPYHAFEYSGFKIWVGRNAQSNDILTQKHTFKEDLWLHAKDVAGSHVVIKYQSGKNFPKDVIERAAQLAAYNSKRKNESLCPVVVTPKKFVRKRKGDPAGAVVVEREEIIMVEPRK